MKFWCASAFIPTEDMLMAAEILDDSAFHGVMVSDHLMYPRQLGSPYPYSPYEDGRPIWNPETEWPEAWVLIAAMAARTTRLHFGTNVYITPARPLLQVAKEIATVSRISNGRVLLGAGAGWMREEFVLQGQDFDNRGKRMNEQIEALRALWQPGWVEFHGEYYDVPATMLGPAPRQPIPILVGGQSTAALRRAAVHGDGWIGTHYSFDGASEYIGRLERLRDAAGTADRPFEIILALDARPTPDLFRRAAEELGVTGAMCMPWALPPFAGQPLTERVMRDSIESFTEQVIAPLLAS